MSVSDDDIVAVDDFFTDTFADDFLVTDFFVTVFVVGTDAFLAFAALVAQRVFLITIVVMI